MLKNSLANATRQQKVDAVAEAMIRHGEGCTAADIMNVLDITPIDLENVAADARIRALRRSQTQTVARVPARKAA